MNHETYINQILDLVVKLWLVLGGGEDFVLEEDGDSGHSYLSTDNAVKL